MEVELIEQKSNLIQLLEPLEPKIKQEIMNLTNLNPKYWWYLEKPAEKLNFQSFCFDPSDNFLITYGWRPKMRLFNIKTQQEIDISYTKHSGELNSACFDSSGKFLAITLHNYSPSQHSYNNKTNIIDLQTYESIAWLSCGEKEIYFDSSERYSMVPRMSFKPYVITQYKDYTLEQLLLKKAFLTWLLIEKPNKKIITIEQLLEDVVLKCTIPYGLLEIWSTFPQNMQEALWRTMEHRIQTYGKDINKDNCIVQ
jgi:hypothetical protein